MLENFNTRYLNYCAGAVDSYFAGHEKKVAPVVARREVTRRVNLLLKSGKLPVDLPASRDLMIYLEYRSSKLPFFIKSEKATAASGRSYFGSGGYNSWYRTFGDVTKSEPIGRNDNGFMSESVFEFILAKGAAVYAGATDDIGNGRTFRNELYYNG